MANKEKINWRKLLLELLVVFLGVTSGFVLNNWRDNNKNIQLEKRYIESFIQNIDSNIVSLEDDIATDTVLLNKLDEKLKASAFSELENDSIISFVNLILYVSKLDIQTSTYEDIKHSGNLNIIHNYSLKENIVEYYDYVSGAFYVDKHYNSFFSEQILPFAMKNINFNASRFMTNDKNNKIRLFNIGMGYYSMRQQRTIVLKGLLKESKKLKSQLEVYLKEEY